MTDKQDKRIENFVRTVRYAALDNHISLERLAKEIGINKVSLGNKMHYRTSFRLEEVYAICDRLGMEITVSKKEMREGEEK